MVIKMMVTMATASNETGRMGKAVLFPFAKNRRTSDRGKPGKVAWISHPFKSPLVANQSLFLCKDSRESGKLPGGFVSVLVLSVSQSPS